MTTSRRETMLLRFLAFAILFFGIVLALPGCAVVKDKLGGQVFGASVSLAGVTVSVNGTVPTGDTKAPAPAAPTP